MTSLICLVQRLSLGDSSRSLVKEGEQFEVDEQIAEQYIKGGIAKLVPVVEAEMKNNASMQTETKAPETVAEPVAVQDPVQEDPPVTQREDKRKKKA